MKVLIYGLSSLTMRSQVESALAPFGNCAVCELVQDLQTGASLGLCRVRFAGKDNEDQHEAAKKLVQLSPKIQVGLDFVQAEFDQRGEKERKIIENLHAKREKERNLEAAQGKQRSSEANAMESQGERPKLTQEQWVSERIGNLPYIFISRIGWPGFRATSKGQIRNHFGAFRAYRVLANATGFFVVFEDAKEAAYCYKAMDGKSFNGFPLALKLQQMPSEDGDTSMELIRDRISNEIRDVVAREILTLFVVPYIHDCVERQTAGLIPKQKPDGTSTDNSMILPSFRKKRRRLELAEQDKLVSATSSPQEEDEDEDIKISDARDDSVSIVNSEPDRALVPEESTDPFSQWLPSRSSLPHAVAAGDLGVSVRNFQDLVSDEEDFEFAKAAFSGVKRRPNLDITKFLKEQRHLESVYAFATDGVQWKRNPTPAWRTQPFHKIPSHVKDSYLLARRRNGPVDVIQVDNAEPLEAEVHNSSREKRMESRRVARALQYNRQRYGMNTELFFESSLNRRAKNVRLARSAIHDWGLYAAEPIEAREFVIEYVGELLRDEFSDARERQYLAEGLDSSYLFRIDLEHIVDATKCGNQARFINHSCDPSLEAKIIRVDGAKRIVLYALRDISPGEELTFDYKFTAAEEGEDRVKCMCGSEKCRGYLF